ncbi:MAG: hypothetical protein JXR96_00905 [Deltaproteobacteria bacterium]|nr:hypothetical protein [Deltaproteobacteria bacterium]
MKKTSISMLALATLLLGGCQPEAAPSDGGADDGQPDGAADVDQPSDAGIDAADADGGGPSPAGPWVVFSVPTVESMDLSPNLLANPELSALAADSSGFEGWVEPEAGWEVDDQQVHSPPYAARAVSATTADWYGAYQSVQLDQLEPRPLFISAWSRAGAIEAEAPSPHYSVYLDLRYDDGSSLYGQQARFSVEPHDWEYRELFILPEKPVRSLSYHLLFRYLAGEVWFDDLALHEVRGAVLPFEDQPVVPASSGWPEDGGVQTLATGDSSLSLGLSERGGAVRALSADGHDVFCAPSAYASGFFLRDQAAGSDWIHVGGTLEAQAGALVQQGDTGELGLSLSATWRAHPGHISVEGQVTNTAGGTRAVTLYLALPVDAAGWIWSDDIRRDETICCGKRYANETTLGSDPALGATGRASVYPWGGVSGQAGLAVAYPMDRPQVARISYDDAAKLLVIAADFALSPLTDAFPDRAPFSFAVYAFPPEWRFRAASQRYYEIFPQLFERRVQKHGLWVAFSPLDHISDIDDFHIAYHELGSLSQVAFDDAHDIASLRYILEPIYAWFTFDEQVPNDSREAILAELERWLSDADERKRLKAQAALVSAAFDTSGQYDVVGVDDIPWCPHGARFRIDADAGIDPAPHEVNWATLHWNDDARAAYGGGAEGELDGEYIDSFSNLGTAANFRESHFRSTTIPLIYTRDDHRPCILQIHSNYLGARFIEDEIFELGKLRMANVSHSQFPFLAHLMDINGHEIRWFDGAVFTPYDDRLMSLRRTAVHQKPYGFLLNADFSQVSHAAVETYMRYCLFYGFFPSFFSHNASEDRYWDDPALFERDRPHFVKYVGAIRQLSEAGWEPMTHARSSSELIRVERFGRGPGPFFLTLRNADPEQAQAFSLTVDLDAAGSSEWHAAAVEELLDSAALTSSLDGRTLAIEGQVPPSTTWLLRLSPG